VSLWLESFADLSDDVLEAAFKRTLATCKFWPVKIADVREHIDQADAKGRELEADQEWENALRVATEFWHPEIGLYQNAPRLSPAAWHALKSAGGLSHVFNCSREDLQWARKRFVAAYTLIHETGQVEHLLGAGEAKRILAQIKAGPPRMQFAAPKPSARAESSAGGIPRNEVRAILDRIVKPSAPQLPTEKKSGRRYNATRHGKG
jgi:hypothetical protein